MQQKVNNGIMMMIAPNSFVRQKNVVQVEEKEWAGDRRKGDQTGTPMPGADAPTCTTYVSVRGVGCGQLEKI